MNTEIKKHIQYGSYEYVKQLVEQLYGQYDVSVIPYHKTFDSTSNTLQEFNVDLNNQSLITGTPSIQNSLFFGLISIDVVINVSASKDTPYFVFTRLDKQVTGTMRVVRRLRFNSATSGYQWDTGTVVLESKDCLIGGVTDLSAGGILQYNAYATGWIIKLK